MIVAASVPAGSAEASESETPHRFLRRATRPWHTAVEDAFAGLDLATQAGLTAFLRAQAAAVLPLERELDRRGAGALLPDWGARRRGGALQRDLAALGSDVPSTLGADPLLDTAARQFGALYVLEGSRLGGRVLARLAEASLNPIVRRATGFLRHQAGPRAWAGFLLTLDGSAPDRDELLDGARQAFSLFGERARLSA